MTTGFVLLALLGGVLVPGGARWDGQDGPRGTYYRHHADDDAHAKEALRAAYEAVEESANPSTKIEWWENVVAAFDRYKSLADARNEPVGTKEREMAAESAYRALNGRLLKMFDGKQHDAGPADDVEARHQLRLERARSWDAKLNAVEAYGVLEWTVAATTRQGSLYDGLHATLHELKDPALSSFVTEELAQVDRILVDRYLRAIELAGRNPKARAQAERAKQRLVDLEPVIGPEKLAAYTRGRQGFEYRPGTFKRLYGARR